MSKKGSTQIRISCELKELLENIQISSAGMKAQTMDDKIGHLLWFYKSYKNNNGNKK